MENFTDTFPVTRFFAKNSMTSSNQEISHKMICSLSLNQEIQFSMIIFKKEDFKRIWPYGEESLFAFIDMRHTATTLLISTGIDLKTVQEICGHENIMTTMNYTHLLADNIKKVADLFSISG